MLFQKPSKTKQIAATWILRSKYLTAFRRLVKNRYAKAAMCKVVKEVAKQEIKNIKGNCVIILTLHKIYHNVPVKYLTSSYDRGLHP